MSYQCEQCGKKSMRGNLVSHSKQRTKRIFKPNLHTYHLVENGKIKKLRVCTTCIKTNKKKSLKIEEARLKQQKEQRIINKSSLPKIDKPEIENKSEKIPEEARLAMKEKSKKAKQSKIKDMDLVEEILHSDWKKEEKKKA